jgi:hypothetical protein
MISSVDDDADVDDLKSKLFYDWRFTANHFILAPDPSRPTARDF